MLVGHFAVGFLAKRVEPKLSLGTLVLAAMLADFLWVIFLIAGIENVQFKPGMELQTTSLPSMSLSATAC